MSSVRCSCPSRLCSIVRFIGWPSWFFLHNRKLFALQQTTVWVFGSVLGFVCSFSRFLCFCLKGLLWDVSYRLRTGFSQRQIWSGGLWLLFGRQIWFGFQRSFWVLEARCSWTFQGLRIWLSMFGCLTWEWWPVFSFLSCLCAWTEFVPKPFDIWFGGWNRLRSISFGIIRVRPEWIKKYRLFLYEIFESFDLFSVLVAFSGLFSELLNLNFIRVPIKVFLLNFLIPESTIKLLEFVFIETINKSLNLSGLEKTNQFDMLSHEIFSFSWKASNHWSELNEDGTCECHKGLQVRCCSRELIYEDLVMLADWYWKIFRSCLSSYLFCKKN